MASNKFDKSVKAVKPQQAFSQAHSTLQKRSMSLPIRLFQQTPCATDCTHLGISSRRASAPQVTRKTLVPKSRIHRRYSSSRLEDQEHRRWFESFALANESNPQPLYSLLRKDQDRNSGVGLQGKGQIVNKNTCFDKTAPFSVAHPRYSKTYDADRSASTRKPKRKSKSMEEEYADLVALLSDDSAFGRMLDAHFMERDLRMEPKAYGQSNNFGLVASKKRRFESPREVQITPGLAKGCKVKEGRGNQVQVQGSRTGRDQQAIPRNKEMRMKRIIRETALGYHRRWMYRIAVWKD